MSYDSSSRFDEVDGFPDVLGLEEHVIERDGRRYLYNGVEFVRELGADPSSEGPADASPAARGDG